MAIQTQQIDYTYEGETFEGTLAIDDKIAGKRPTVLVSHTWAGRTDFEDGIVHQLAKLGYAGFALDLYGKGKIGTNNEENTALMTPLVSNRAGLQARLLNSLDVVKKLPEVDTGQIAAIGYCFGGLCVLDIARTGVDLSGVASIHGILTPPGNVDAKINSKVMLLHGWDDPMAKPKDVLAVTTELTKAGADWQLHAFGHTMHAFTHPSANNPDFGTLYSKSADDRSWLALKNFLADCFQ